MKLAAAETQQRKSDGVPLVTPSLRLMNPLAQDQDDLCVWRDHQSPDRSVIITSDKSADHLFVYDLQGRFVAIDPSAHCRGMWIFAMTFLSEIKKSIWWLLIKERTASNCDSIGLIAKTRELVAIDQGGIATGANYGGCLYRSSQDGRLYFFTTSKENGCEQIELTGK